jgi:hypothetical protein
MVEGQRTEREIKRSFRYEVEDIRDSEGDFGIRMGTLDRQLEGGRLKIHCGDPNGNIVGAAPIDHEPGNIAESSAQIEDAERTAWVEPSTEEIPNQPVTSEEPVKLLKILEVSHQLRRYGLRAVHHFDGRLVESPGRNQ